jgi:AraC-like DNA-binding protein
MEDIMNPFVGKTMGTTQIHLCEMQVVGRTTREWIVYERECPALARLGIQYTGISHAGAGFAFCRLAPRIAVVFGSLSGTGQVLVDGKWRKCGAGDVYITPAWALHAYHAIKGEKWHLCWVVYEEEVSKQTVIQSKRAYLRKDSSQGLRDAIMGLYDEVHGLNEAPAVHDWAELVDLSARRLIQERKIDERLMTLWSNVDTELARHWTLESLANQIHLSPEQLRHLCQKHFGRSPMKHLTDLRMKRAAGLLVRTNQKIAVVAADVGYENAFAFSTAFKRVVGVSPAEYLRTQSRKRPPDRIKGGVAIAD